MGLRDRIWIRLWRIASAFYAGRLMPVPVLLCWRALGYRLTGKASPLLPPPYALGLEPSQIRHPAIRESLAGVRLSHWGMDVECINALARYIEQNRVHSVLEFGSGVSTVVLSLLCREAAGGQGARPQVLSFDEGADYADISRCEIEARGLSDVAHVMHCPLGPRLLDGESVQGYSWESSLSEVVPDGWAADLVLVDGPSSGGLARAAAAVDGLACGKPGCLVLMDDGLRDEEIQCMRHLHRREYITFRGVMPVGKGLAVGRATCS